MSSHRIGVRARGQSRGSDPKRRRRSAAARRAPGGIYLLRGRDAEPASVSTTPLSEGDALVGLLAHTHVSHLMRREDRPRELAALGALVRMVPVQWLTVPALPDGFEALLETLGLATAT